MKKIILLHFLLLFLLNNIFSQSEIERLRNAYVNLKNKSITYDTAKRHTQPPKPGIKGFADFHSLKIIEVREIVKNANSWLSPHNISNETKQEYDIINDLCLFMLAVLKDNRQEAMQKLNSAKLHYQEALDHRFKPNKYKKHFFCEFDDSNAEYSMNKEFEWFENIVNSSYLRESENIYTDLYDNFDFSNEIGQFQKKYNCIRGEKILCIKYSTSNCPSGSHNNIHYNTWKNDDGKGAKYYKEKFSFNNPDIIATCFPITYFAAHCMYSRLTCSTKIDSNAINLFCKAEREYYKLKGSNYAPLINSYAEFYCGNTKKETLGNIKKELDWIKKHYKDLGNCNNGNTGFIDWKKEYHKAINSYNIKAYEYFIKLPGADTTQYYSKINKKIDSINNPKLKISKKQVKHYIKKSANENVITFKETSMYLDSTFINSDYPQILIITGIPDTTTYNYFLNNYRKFSPWKYELYLKESDKKLISNMEVDIIFSLLKRKNYIANQKNPPKPNFKSMSSTLTSIGYFNKVNKLFKNKTFIIYNNKALGVKSITNLKPNEYVSNSIFNTYNKSDKQENWSNPPKK